MSSNHNTSAVTTPLYLTPSLTPAVTPLPRPFVMPTLTKHGKVATLTGFGDFGASEVEPN